MTMVILFLTLLFLIVPLYVYIGYPILLIIFSKIRTPLPVDKAEITPTVALFVSCYNEINVIEDKIQNSLAIDYPRDKIDYIFISDGSDDGTDEIIKRYQDQGIKLIRQEGRLGKTSGLNLAMPTTQAEIIVFSDANAIYEPNAVKMLVRNFNDPAIGYVVGAALYTDTQVTASARSENKYWEYEIAVKKMETSLHSVVGGDGAIYAIRKFLYEPLDEKDINDFVNPLQIITKGYRGIFEPEAKCYEETAGDFEKEARRKVRIVNRSFRGLMKVSSVLNPLNTGIFSFEIISHKLLRWLVPFFLIFAIIGMIYLSSHGYFLFQVMLLLGILLIWFSAVGYIKSGYSNISPIFSYPYYFLMINTASLLGIIQAIKGNIQVTWESARLETNKKPSNFKFSMSLSLLLLLSIFLFFDTINRIFEII